MKILIVEDEHELLIALNNFLVKENFICELASNFRNADEKLSVNEYDIILLDITLPDGNGLDLITKSRKLQKRVGILISNLLSNSINHNIISGIIEISVKRNSLNICNTGPDNQLTDETIFNRFVKGKSKSFGLRLAIVKKKCETNDLEIHYHKNDLHCFTISRNT